MLAFLHFSFTSFIYFLSPFRYDLLGIINKSASILFPLVLNVLNHSGRTVLWPFIQSEKTEKMKLRYPFWLDG